MYFVSFVVTYFLEEHGRLIPFYVGAATDGSVWRRGGEQSRRVGRGGSWFNTAGFCRSAYRLGDDLGLRYNDLGFRVVLVSP